MKILIFLSIFLCVYIPFAKAQADDIFLTVDELKSIKDNSLAVFLQIPATTNCLTLIAEYGARIAPRPCLASSISQRFFVTKSNHLAVAQPTANGRFYLYLTARREFATRRLLSELSRPRSCTASAVDAKATQPQWLLSCDEKACLQFDDHGKAVYSDENYCDEFIAQPYTADPFVVAQGMEVSQFAQPLNTLLDLTQSLGCKEGRMILSADAEAFCVAFSGTDADSKPHLYRARCDLSRSQIFYRSSAGLFVILPVGDSQQLFEMYQLRVESGVDGDVRGFYPIAFNKVKTASDVVATDKGKWKISADSAGTVYFRKDPNFRVTITRPGSPAPDNDDAAFIQLHQHHTKRIQRAWAKTPVQCNVVPSVSCKPNGVGGLAFEYVHSRSDSVWEVTINHMYSQERIQRVGDKLKFQAPSARNRWMIDMQKLAPITYTDTRGNQFCWYIAPGQEAVTVAQYGFARRIKAVKPVKSFVNITASQCTQFKTTIIGQDYLSENLTPGFCLTLNGEDVGFANCFYDSYHLDTVRFAPLADELTVGRIVAYPQSSQCLTFQGANVAASALQLKPCDASNNQQLFAYGKYSGRLYNSNSQALFFWWHKLIRAYNAIPSLFVNDGNYYSWSMNIRGMADAIMARDGRGYSGACLSEKQSGSSDVLGSQRCGLFRFQPSSPLPSQYFGLSSGMVRITTIQSGEKKCVTAVFEAYFTMNVLNLGPCNTLSFPEVDGSLPVTQFVLSSFSPSCTNCEIKVNIAYGTNTGNSMIRPQGASTETNRWLGQSSYQSSPWFKVKVGVNAPIVSARADDNGCWALQPGYEGRLVLSKNLPCVDFLIEPFYSSSTDLPSSVYSVTGFAAKYYNTLPMSHIDLGFTARNHFEFRGSAYTIDKNAGLIRINPTNAKRTAFVLPTKQDRDISSKVQFPWIENAPFASSQGVFGLIQVRFNSYLANPIQGASYLLMSNLRYSGCTVYVTSGSRIGLQCFNKGKKIASCQSKAIFSGGSPFNMFNPSAADATVVALLYSTTKTTDNIVFLAGHPILRCPNSEDWSATSEFIYMFDDASQWQHRAWGAVVRSAAFMVSDNATALISVAQRARQTAPVVTTSPMGVGSTTWGSCVSVSRPSYVDAVRCSVTLSGGVDVGALSLGCSRPGCSLQAISTSPVVVEYRPNYPDWFNSEPVGASVGVNDDALLTDGFSTLQFNADMTFNDGGAVLLQTSEEIGQQGGMDVTDCHKYMSLETFKSVQPYVPDVSNEAVF